MGRLASLVVFVALIPASASAEVFKLFGEIHGGGMYGAGTAGDQKDSAFFAKSPRATYGALVGAELLMFDGWIQHHQYTDGTRLTTWTQFGLGLHYTYDTGDAQQRKAHEGGYVEFGGGVWFGVGTGQQVVPPLDNAQISDKAFIGEGRIGFGLHLDKLFDFGLVVPVSYGYFFKSGNGATANNLSDNYRGWQIEGLLALRVNLRLF